MGSILITARRTANEGTMGRRSGFNHNELLIVLALLAIFIALTVVPNIRLLGAGFGILAAVALVVAGWGSLFAAFALLTFILKGLFLRDEEFWELFWELVFGAFGILILLGLCWMLWDLVLNPFIGWLQG
jgi:hypothetical protein